ncbi:MAG: pentapeptide repeat-containing protein, partial [Pirellulaceae bacterium]
AEDADFSEANLTDVFARRASFRNSKMIRVVARYGKFTKSNFSGTNLTKSDFSMADLQCRMEGVNGREMDLRGADLSNSSLKGSDLSFANLLEAKLVNVDMAGVKLINAIGPSGQRIGAPAAPRSQKRAWWQFWAQ